MSTLATLVIVAIAVAMDQVSAQWIFDDAVIGFIEWLVAVGTSMLLAHNQPALVFAGATFVLGARRLVDSARLRWMLRGVSSVPMTEEQRETNAKRRR